MIEFHTLLVSSSNALTTLLNRLNWTTRMSSLWRTAWPRRTRVLDKALRSACARTVAAPQARA